MSTTKKEKVLGVLPARLQSTRLPRKMLAEIDGKPLIYYTWLQASKAASLDAVVVATDSSEIADVVKAFGGEVIMTSPSHKTGSDRVAEAARKYKKFKPSIVVNIQGDEPFIHPEAIDQMVNALKKNKTAVMATVATPCDDMQRLKDPDTVKTILDQQGYAIYFSRCVLPYPRTEYHNYYSKLGLYGFRAEFLQKYVKMPQTPLEIAESLEQLRAIENGYKILAPVGNYIRIEVNNMKQLKQARAFYKAQTGAAKKRR